MRRLIIALVALSALMMGTVGTAGANIGGTEIEVLADAPHLVQVGTNFSDETYPDNIQNCTGTMVAYNMVLTAASCLTNGGTLGAGKIDPDLYFVNVTVSPPIEHDPVLPQSRQAIGNAASAPYLTGTYHADDGIFVHPLFNPGNPAASRDLALIVTSADFTVGSPMDIASSKFTTTRFTEDDVLFQGIGCEDAACQFLGSTRQIHGGWWAENDAYALNDVDFRGAFWRDELGYSGNNTDFNAGLHIGVASALDGSGDPTISGDGPCVEDTFGDLGGPLIDQSGEVDILVGLLSFTQDDGNGSDECEDRAAVFMDIHGAAPGWVAGKITEFGSLPVSAN